MFSPVDEYEVDRFLGYVQEAIPVVHKSRRSGGMYYYYDPKPVAIDEEELAHADQSLRDALKKINIIVTDRIWDRSAQDVAIGMYNDMLGAIWISPDIEPAQRFATLCHETAHALTISKMKDEGIITDRATKRDGVLRRSHREEGLSEVVAECAATIVGLDYIEPDMHTLIYASMYADNAGGESAIATARPWILQAVSDMRVMIREGSSYKG